MKLNDADRQRLQELAGEDGIPEGIISADGHVDVSELNKWIAARQEKLAASWTDEDEQRWAVEHRQKIAKLREFIDEPKDDDDDCYFLLSDDERAARKAEDEAAYEEMLADEIDVFALDYLPPDIARMISKTLVPNTLLKAEIELLKTEEGRGYMFERMCDVARAKKAVADGNSVVKRCYPKWRKCECYQ